MEIQTIALQADSSPPQWQLQNDLIKWLACCSHTGLSLSLSLPLCLSISLCHSVSHFLSVALHLTHKPEVDARTLAHPPHIHPLSSYHADTQGSPSVGQWKTVAMAAHPEPCCRMIRGVMLLNQPPFSALHCCLYAATHSWNTKWYNSDPVASTHTSKTLFAW